MKRAAIFISLLFLLACNKGTWGTQSTYRPKHPRFSILKKLFVQNEQISTQFLFVPKKKCALNFEERVMHDFVDFLSDGRMIAVSVIDLVM